MSNSAKYVQNNRIKKARWIKEYKTGKACADCGVTYPPYVMHFDHLPGTEKVFNLSMAVANNISMKRIEEEIAKCELVCANCHAERTWSRLNPEEASTALDT